MHFRSNQTTVLEDHGGSRRLLSHAMAAWLKIDLDCIRGTVSENSPASVENRFPLSVRETQSILSDPLIDVN